MGLRRDQTRARILDAAYEAFWRSGFSRTNVDGIAERAKLTKRTLYAHFRSKDDLLAAVLEHQSELARARMADIDARLTNTPNGLIDSLFSQLAAWQTRQRSFAGSGFTRLAAELADMPGHPARAIAARHKLWVERWYAQRLRKVGVTQAEAKARQIMLLIEGSMSLVVIHGDRDYFAAAAKAAKRLL
jgi:AcrR family transcriptional regulator